MTFRAVLIDNDDCIVPTGPEKTSLDFYKGAAELWQVLGELKEKDIPAGICTGRDRNYVEHGAFWLGCRVGWSIIESGVALFHPVTKELRLNPALTPEVKSAFAELRSQWIPEILQKCPGLFEYPGNIIQLTFEREYGVETPIEDFYRVIKEMLRPLEERRLLVVHASQIAVDISPVGKDGKPVDKSSGVDLFCEVAETPPEEILGIGDSRGDFPMLAKVGFAGCPANAKEECKEMTREKGGYISPHQYAKGVADVLRYYLEEG